MFQRYRTEGTLEVRTYRLCLLEATCFLDKIFLTSQCPYHPMVLNKIPCTLCTSPKAFGPWYYLMYKYTINPGTSEICISPTSVLKYNANK